MNTSSTVADSTVSAVHYERQSRRFIDEFARGHCLPFLHECGSDISIIYLDIIVLRRGGTPQGGGSPGKKITPLYHS